MALPTPASCGSPGQAVPGRNGDVLLYSQIGAERSLPDNRKTIRGINHCKYCGGSGFQPMKQFKPVDGNRSEMVRTFSTTYNY